MEEIRRRNTILQVNFGKCITLGRGGGRIYNESQLFTVVGGRGIVGLWKLTSTGGGGGVTGGSNFASKFANIHVVILLNDGLEHFDLVRVGKNARYFFKTHRT